MYANLRYSIEILNIIIINHIYTAIKILASSVLFSAQYFDYGYRAKDYRKANFKAK